MEEPKTNILEVIKKYDSFIGLSVSNVKTRVKLINLYEKLIKFVKIDKLYILSKLHITNCMLSIGWDVDNWKVRSSFNLITDEIKNLDLENADTLIQIEKLGYFPIGGDNIAIFLEPSVTTLSMLEQINHIIIKRLIADNLITEDDYINKMHGRINKNGQYSRSYHITVIDKINKTEGLKIIEEINKNDGAKIIIGFTELCLYKINHNEHENYKKALHHYLIW